MVFGCYRFSSLVFLDLSFVLFCWTVRVRIFCVMRLKWGAAEFFLVKSFAYGDHR